MKVFLDSNMFISDFHLASVHWKQFLEHYRKIPSVAFVPQVVADEVVNKYAERLEESVLALNKANSEIHRLLVKASSKTQIDIAKEKQNYRTWLLSALETYGIRVLEYPKIDAAKVVRHDLSRKRPFKADGSGFRDYLVFLTIVEHFDVHYDSIAFLTANKRDFYQDDKLHPDLTELYPKHRSANETEMFQSLKDFNDKYLANYIQPRNEALKVTFKATSMPMEDYLRQEIQNILWEQSGIENMFDLKSPNGHVSHIDKIKETRYETLFASETGLRIVKAVVELVAVITLDFDRETVENDPKAREFVGNDLDFNYSSVDTKDTIRVELEIRLNNTLIEDVNVVHLETSYGSY